MKLSKKELKAVADYRKKIEDAKKKDVIKLFSDVGYNMENLEQLKRQLILGKLAQHLVDLGYDTEDSEQLKKQLEVGKTSAPELFAKLDSEQ